MSDGISDAHAENRASLDVELGLIRLKRGCWGFHSHLCGLPRELVEEIRATLKPFGLEVTNRFEPFEDGERR